MANGISSSNWIGQFGQTVAIISTFILGTIGLMAMALALSLFILGIGQFVPALEHGAVAILEGIDFNKTLMHGMLGLLLFAGALHVDIIRDTTQSAK